MCWCFIHYCMYVCTYVCMYVCLCICMYVCLYVCMNVCYVCTYVRMYVCTYVCMYVCTYICMYVRMYASTVSLNSCATKSRTGDDSWRLRDPVRKTRIPAIHVNSLLFAYSTTQLAFSWSPEPIGSGVLIRLYWKNQLLCVLSTPANSKLCFETGISTNRYYNEWSTQRWEERGPTSKKSTTPRHGLSFHQSAPVWNADV